MGLRESIIWIDDKGAVGSAKIHQYPGGEPLINHDRSVRIERLLLRPRSMLGLMAGLFFVDALTARGWKTPELILPFVPGSRQDRLNPTGDFLFTARSVAKELNARNFPRLTILDPHSDVIPALLERCHVISAATCLPKEHTWVGVISPDAGAEKRASLVAGRLGVPMLHAWKKRDVGTGAISGFGLEPTGETPDGRWLVVDDICDGGGTFIGLADVLRARGIEADLYVTHAIFSQGTEKLSARFGRIICTDSVEQEVSHSSVNVQPICSNLLTVGKAS